MMSSTDDNNDLAEDIFGRTEYAAPERPAKRFYRWHFPRKQFVRHYQWCQQIKALLNDTGHIQGDTLKYLGLPGDELFDLRHFHDEICSPSKVKLQFLGFNVSAAPGNEHQAELDISLDEVRKLEWVDEQSDVMWDDICNIANENSIAWKRVINVGPFDVVNLDLCDGFGKHVPGRIDNNHYNALNRLLGMQQRRTKPWILFLTTRTDVGSNNADFIDRLIEKFRENLRDSNEFRNASADEFGVGTFQELSEYAKTREGHLSVFLTGIFKWLAGIAVQTPPSNVELKSTISYLDTYGRPHDDLVSLAIRFEPVILPPIDPAGIASVVPCELPTEGALATKAVKRLKSRKSADKILEQDINIRTEMIAATKLLLESARYDINTYDEWLLTNGGN